MMLSGGMARAVPPFAASAASTLTFRRPLKKRIRHSLNLCLPTPSRVLNARIFPLF
jgi:hypothetical protein